MQLVQFLDVGGDKFRRTARSESPGSFVDRRLRSVGDLAPGHEIDDQANRGQRGDAVDVERGVGAQRD